MRFHHAVFVLSVYVARANGSIVPPEVSDEAPQCVGHTLDFTRLQNVNELDLSNGIRSLAGGGRDYEINTIMPVMDYGTGLCLKKRHRLREKKNGVHVFGADVVITLDDCDLDEAAWGGGPQGPLSGVPLSAVSGIGGKTFANIEVTGGSYEPTYSMEEAIEKLATEFHTTNDKIGSLELTIFPSYQHGDILSYRAEVWVSEDDDISLYDVFIGAHDLGLVSTCSKINKQRQKRIRNLRKNRELQNNFNGAVAASMCGSCADQSLVKWTTTETECDINSLYINDEGRTTTCLIGNLNNGAGKQVLGPGIVSSLHYYGTYDCNSRESGCNANTIPLGCSDAISDVHYGVTETMKFMQDRLGVMGGLAVAAGNPIKTASFVHFGNAYCNAFFTTQTNSLYFGDCDCEFWTPLTSIDVAAHELAHGKYHLSSAKSGCSSR